MMIMKVCTTPSVCLCLFAAVFGIIAILRFMILVGGVSVLVFPIVLQAVAGHVTSKSEQLLKELIGFAYSSPSAQTKQRLQLMLMMEDLGSKHRPLAVRSAMGEVCTGLAFMQFLGEIIALFSLPYFFSSFLHLK